MLHHRKVALQQCQALVFFRVIHNTENPDMSFTIIPQTKTIICRGSFLLDLVK